MRSEREMDFHIQSAWLLKIRNHKIENHKIENHKIKKSPLFFMQIGCSLFFSLKIEREEESAERYIRIIRLKNGSEQKQNAGSCPAVPEWQNAQGN